MFMVCWDSEISCRQTTRGEVIGAVVVLAVDENKQLFYIIDWCIPLIHSQPYLMLNISMSTNN